MNSNTNTDADKISTEGKRVRSHDTRKQFVDNDSSLFLETKPIHGESFDENNHIATHTSSVNEILKKRQGSTERTRIQRPRSSKGNRVLQSTSHSQIPKIVHNRSEERNLKSQGGNRISSQHSNNKRNTGSHNNALLADSTLVKNQSFGMGQQSQIRNLIEPNSTLLGHLMPDSNK